MFLLTMGPDLYYVDPSNMVLKGRVPFGLTLRAEAKNFKNFHVHTVINNLLILNHYIYSNALLHLCSREEHICLKIQRGLPWSGAKLWKK